MSRASRKRRKPITLFPISEDKTSVSKRTRSQRLKSHKFNEVDRFPIPVDQKIRCGKILDFNKDVWECLGYVRESNTSEHAYPYRSVYLHIIDNVKFRHTPVACGRPMDPIQNDPPSPGSSGEENEDPCPYRHTATYNQVCRELKYYARELNLFGKPNVKGYKTPKEHFKREDKLWGPHITIPVDSRDNFPVGTRVTLKVKPRLVFPHVPDSREWIIMVVDDRRLENGHLSIAEYIEPYY